MMKQHPPKKNEQLFAAFSAANFHRRNSHSLTLHLFLRGSFKALGVGGMGTFLFLCIFIYFFGEGNSDSWGLWQQGRRFRCPVSTWTRVSWVVELVWSCVWAARPGTLAHLQLLGILFSSFAA